MEYRVVKRDGSHVPFDPTKIRNAIYKAILASHTQEELKERFSNEILDDITNQVVEKCQDIMDITSTQHILIIPKDIKDNETTFKTGVTISINGIQDIVEKTLIRNGFADTAKEYILYRAKRDEIRKSRDSINKAISDVLMSDSKDSDTKRENANIDGNTAMGTMLQVGANVSKNYYLNNMMSKDIAKAHTDGYIHIHDLDFYKLTVTCCQIDFEKLVKGGFNTGHGYLREPQSIGSYATLAAIAIQSDQSDCHGGQSIPNFDYSMRQGIYKSFRKAWKNNIDKFNKFTDTECGLKDSSELTDSDIEEILGNGFPFIGTDKKIIETVVSDVKRECYQAMEGFVHNLNTLHSRAGAQVK